MNSIYLSIISSTLVIIGYLPEIYVTTFQIKNIDSTKYSSTIWLFGGILGSLYSGLNNSDTFILVNYSINTSLNLLTLILKIYFYYKFNSTISNETKNSII
uniref:PQ-loop repeat-containing protein n=1 Tax=viral metagenome TaxID=1070528 RepID=A0A6C0DKB4_9ZZZZ